MVSPILVPAIQSRSRDDVSARQHSVPDTFITIPSSPRQNLFGDQFALSPHESILSQSPVAYSPFYKFDEQYRVQSPQSDRISPFDCLPTELVADILLLAVLPRRSELDPEESWPLRRKPRPLLLCAVCRRWRSIAFAAPQLWSRLFLRFKRPLTDGYERILLEEWLERAKTMPLSLSIPRQLYERLDKSRSAVALDRIAKEMTATVLSIMPRCQEVYMGMDRNTSQSSLKITDSLAKYMKSRNEPHVLGGNDVTIDFRQCSNLQTLTSIGDSKYRLSQFHFSELQYRSLRRLTIQGDMKDLYQILTDFSSLVECKFDVRWSSAEDTLTHSTSPGAIPLTLPNLEKLEVRCQYHRTPSSWSLWDQLCLPSLKVCRIDLWRLGDEDEGGPAWLSLYSFMQRSRPPLQQFKLWSAVVIPEHQLIDVLSWMPMLENFQLDVSGNYTHITTEFWRAFCAEQRSSGDRPPHKPICPRLEVLQVHTTTWNGLAGITPTVSSRLLSCDHAPTTRSASGTTNNKLATLRELRVTPCDFTQDEFLQSPGMDLCMRVGLDVKVANSKFSAVFSKKTVLP